jgi:hypothetical protein
MACQNSSFQPPVSSLVAVFALTMLQEEAFKEGTLHSGRQLYAPSHCRALLTIVRVDTL